MPNVDFTLSIGESASFSKTLTETDLSMFTALSGDFDPIHVDEEFAKKTPFGRRIAHGILSMAMLSTVAAAISRRARDRGSNATPVSMGYDRIRFLKPVFVGDTLTAHYTVEQFDAERDRSISAVEVRNHDDELCVVGWHVMKWIGSS